MSVSGTAAIAARRALGTPFQTRLSLARNSDCARSCASELVNGLLQHVQVGSVHDSLGQIRETKAVIGVVPVHGGARPTRDNRHLSSISLLIVQFLSVGRRRCLLLFGFRIRRTGLRRFRPSMFLAS